MVPAEARQAGASRQRKKRLAGGRGDKGSILLNSLEQEMLQWALYGFLPTGPDGLKPTSGLFHVWWPCLVAKCKDSLSDHKLASSFRIIIMVHANVALLA